MARLRNFIVLTFWASLSMAQGNWTLQKCLEVGLQNNISIKQAQLNVANSHLNYRQSKENLLPSVSGFANYNFSFGRNINPVNNSYVQQNVQSSQLGISSQLTLFSGLRNSNSIKLNQVNDAVSLKDLDVINNNLSLQIATQFLQILFSDETVKIEELALAATQKELETAKLLFSVGTTNQSAVLELDAKLASNKLELITAQNSLRLAKIALTQLLQIPFEESFAVERPNIGIPEEIILENTNSIYEKAKKAMPEIERSILKHKAFLIQQSISKGAYFPTLSLTANVSSLFSDNFKDVINPQTILVPIGYVQSTNDLVLAKSIGYDGTKTRSFSNQVNDNLGKSIGFSLSIPIYNNAQIRTQVKQADLQSQQQKLEILRAENELFTSIATAVANYDGALVKYKALAVAVNAQKKNYDFNILRFETGALSSTDLITSQTNYESAEFNLTQGKYDLIFKKVMLDFYRGKPLALAP